jgi:hypothetical protein
MGERMPTSIERTDVSDHGLGMSRDGHTSDRSPIALNELFPRLCRDASPFTAKPFVLRHLAQEKGCRRTVQVSKELKVVILVRALWQLDDRRRLLEDTAAAIEGEVVMSGHLGKSN